ncbi:hypothetical protein K402DRAFT_391263 [Aulographum hederae CBS 113979]|uniref:S-adenosyl-L-methionine-dependent methyltransferase n=1 Tax=Aulographum hederae CBS 113979 TaxID=1176131 RepID=A0A6G1H818_9PEZI|nr:hypothetical protein K402DRAFT_391263 [Aulographum hederae CBS 113979]
MSSSTVLSTYHTPSQAQIQSTYRTQIITTIWTIPPGSRVLEIGCGQGDSTVVLAAAVGPTGHVDAVDPCDPDYGAPMTVGEAQKGIMEGEFGGRIGFYCRDPVEFVKEGVGRGEKWDYVVCFHCLWYFDSEVRIEELLRLLVEMKEEEGKVGRICIAEWALQARKMQQVPHLLAALLRGNLEWVDADSSANIRSLVSPKWIKGVVDPDGKFGGKEKLVEPPEGLKDGQWEVRSIIDSEFTEHVASVVQDRRQAAGIYAMRDAISQAVDNLDHGTEDVAPMLAWTWIV